jgi:TusA-related sulfurtransferase
MVSSAPDPAPQPSSSLDLRGTPCPLNYVRSRLALERLPSGAWLQVDVDGGEPETMVSEGLRGEGHQVLCRPLGDGAIRLLVRRDGAA